MPSALNPGVKKREVFAWSMYDFANSGYTTVVLTAVFNAYFVSVIAQKAAGQEFTITLEKSRTQEEIPAEIFAMPAEVKALALL